MEKKRFQRIIDRSNYLYERGNEEFPDQQAHEEITVNPIKKKRFYEIFSEMDCIDVFFECEKSKTYDFICNFAKENHFPKVYDIGCAYGLQSECFVNTDIEYIGINDSILNYWNKDKYTYIKGTYPFKINANEWDLATSVLCLGWNCYLIEGEKTLREQLEQLSKDFKHCLLYIPIGILTIAEEYFKEYKILGDNFVYFKN